MQIAWDDSLGMAGHARPAITWWTPCGVPEDADWASPAGVCWSDTIRPDLTIDARWFGTFTDQRSGFVVDLFYAKGWALYGDSIIEAHKEPSGAADAKRALQAAGL